MNTLFFSVNSEVRVSADNLLSCSAFSLVRTTPKSAQRWACGDLDKTCLGFPRSSTPLSGTGSSQNASSLTLPFRGCLSVRRREDGLRYQGYSEKSFSSRTLPNAGLYSKLHILQLQRHWPRDAQGTDGPKGSLQSREPKVSPAPLTAPVSIYSRVSFNRGPHPAPFVLSQLSHTQ